jgi:hypothetical protein
MCAEQEAGDIRAHRQEKGKPHNSIHKINTPMLISFLSIPLGLLRYWQTSLFREVMQPELNTHGS